MASLPKFSELPLGKGEPRWSAWGLYGANDELGTLNRLTDDVVVEAAKEIQTGMRISLNWELDAQAEVPMFGRQVFHKEVYQKKPRIVNDDTWYFNTQSSSQWDGLRHFGYQKEEKFYNGVTMDDIHKPGATVNGIQAWAKKGIVGRGILLDYWGWCRANNIPQEPFKSMPILLNDLKSVAHAQGTEIKFGDILIIRSGFMAAWSDLSKQEIRDLAQVNPPMATGVEQTEGMAQWIWENFSAVAGDQPAFECWPAKTEWRLHEVLLAGWGCPIGELWDLEALAQHCSKINRWSFFLTSEPCNVPGGVASPPNVLAIF